MLISPMTSSWPTRGGTLFYKTGAKKPLKKKEDLATPLASNEGRRSISTPHFVTVEGESGEPPTPTCPYSFFCLKIILILKVYVKKSGEPPTPTCPYSFSASKNIMFIKIYYQGRGAFHTYLSLFFLGLKKYHYP